MKALVTGPSGNVGYAAKQLAINRGADMSIVTNSEMKDFFNKITLSHIAVGLNQTIEAFDQRSFDLFVYPVGGKNFPLLLKLFRKMDTYVYSGAIAGPMVSLALKDLYSKDLNIFGATAWSYNTLRNLITKVENNEITPFIAKFFLFTTLLIHAKVY